VRLPATSTQSDYPHDFLKTHNFLRKPSANAAVIGESRLLKLGKSLAVGEVSLFSEGSEEPVAHVVGTYSIRPSARESGK
jgi:acyl-coenzyme A thioesterase PaaI-like protein